MRHALLPPSPLLSPAVSNWRCGKGSRRGAGNPEVLLGRGLGDSFEWNRADSSPVLGARSLLSVRRCSRRQVATRPGEREKKKTTCEKLYLPELARIGLLNRNMDRLLRLGGGMPGLGQGPPTDAPAVDTAEQVYISSLALLKMLKHGRAGVPMEVMGLMLGEFVDDYTVRVIDVFAMPQSGTGVSVEAVDPVFQAKMLDMLKQTGRPEMVVGWYHSHPGFGCWLSGVDINTQQSFEALSERAVAVVVDPIQSVKGKMLLNLHKKSWMEGLTLQDYSEHCKHNESVVKEMLELAKNYNKAVEEEDKMTPEQLAIKNVGKQDPKRHLEEHVDVLMTSNIVQCLAAMLDTVVFK
ncbi:hypothetical protein NN561_009096 [Cricetulus griseus]